MGSVHSPCPGSHEWVMCCSHLKDRLTHFTQVTWHRDQAIWDIPSFLSWIFLTDSTQFCSSYFLLASKLHTSYLLWLILFTHFIILLYVLGIELRTSYMLGKCLPLSPIHSSHLFIFNLYGRQCNIPEEAESDRHKLKSFLYLKDLGFWLILWLLWALISLSLTIK